jgi:hypothetical protein
MIPLPRVVTLAEAESVDCVVCVGMENGLVLEDNVITQCASCGGTIQHRPDAPAKPKKLCMPCAVSQMTADPEGAQIVATQTYVDRLRRILKRHLN